VISSRTVIIFLLSRNSNSLARHGFLKNKIWWYLGHGEDGIELKKGNLNASMDNAKRAEEQAADAFQRSQDSSHEASREQHHWQNRDIVWRGSTEAQVQLWA
jgi:hypothetical protein